MSRSAKQTQADFRHASANRQHWPKTEESQPFLEEFSLPELARRMHGVQAMMPLEAIGQRTVSLAVVFEREEEGEMELPM